MKLRHTGVGHFEVSVSNFTPKQSVTCATGTNPYNNNIGLVPIDSYTVIITEATQDKQQTYNLQENKEKKKKTLHKQWQEDPNTILHTQILKW